MRRLRNFFQQAGDQENVDPETVKKIPIDSEMLEDMLFELRDEDIKCVVRRDKFIEGMVTVVDLTFSSSASWKKLMDIKLKILIPFFKKIKKLGYEVRFVDYGNAAAIGRINTPSKKYPDFEIEIVDK